MGRIRLRTLIANANATVNQASGQIQRTSNNANEAIDFAEALMAELMDGIGVKLVRKGEGTFMQFAMGQIDELPFELRIDLKEGGEKE
jgi:hypothetical protein